MTRREKITLTIAGGITTVCVLGIIITMSAVKTKDKKIESLITKQEEQQMEMAMIHREIAEKELEGKLEKIGWSGDEELTALLSMTKDNFTSATSLVLPTEAEDMIREHFKDFAKDIPFVGAVELMRWPEEDLEYPISEGYGMYDLNFFINIEHFESLEQESEEYWQTIEKYQKHDIMGL